MAVYKCKMCGGTLDITEGQSVYECEYCGTKQTLPRLDNEKRLNLYNRASQFRQRCAFDKAAGIYEKIVEETPDDAEAHWSLVLCRYGIEYVEDPGTGDRMPTCHRASMDPIFDDVDYIDAIKYADPAATGLYKKEAARIDWILKGILEISAKEEPYDVFICYKETNDSTGDRTLDSVKAQEIYDALTEKGYKVFFSRITLEGKLGKDYESIIFAALNSAKVMLVVTADPDNTEAVWVKNEWSRYLKIMAKNKGRVLIPCYLKMDPYLLPDEFSNLQGQDMGKIGFLQDLVRGVGKLIPKKPAQPAGQTAAVPGGVVASFASLMKRVELFIETGDYDSANATCDKILDADPENVEAYIKKLLIEFRAKNIDELSRNNKEFYKSINFRMALRFGGDAVEKTVFGSSNASTAMSFYLIEGNIPKLKEYAKKYPSEINSSIILESFRKYTGEDLLSYYIDCGYSVDSYIGYDKSNSLGHTYHYQLPLMMYLYENGFGRDEVKKLVEKGADINLMKEKASVGEIKVGDTVFRPTTEKESLLCVLMEEAVTDGEENCDGVLEFMEYCLEHGADTKQVRYVKVDGYSSISALSHLMRMSEEKCSSKLKSRIAELLVKHGADLYFGEEHLLGNGKLDRLTLVQSMLYADAPLRQYDFLKKLGYSPAKEPFAVIYYFTKKLSDLPGLKGRSKLQNDLVYFVRSGFDVDTPFEKDGVSETAVYNAAMNLCGKTIDILMRGRADPDKGIVGKISSKKGYGTEIDIPPVYAAIDKALASGANNDMRKEAEDIINTLLKCGADPDYSVKEYSGRTITLMEYVFDMRESELKQTLLAGMIDRGGNTGIKRKDGDHFVSMLQYAAVKLANNRVVGKILDNGADPNEICDVWAGSNYGDIPVIGAVILDCSDPRSAADIVRTLLDHGASWDTEAKWVFKGKSFCKPVGKMPFNKLTRVDPDVIRAIKLLGWKGSLF